MYKVLDLIRKEKNLKAEVAKIFGKNEPSTHKIVKKEKEICVNFAVTPQTAKVVVIVCDKCLVKLEKALGFYSFRTARETTFT